MSEHPLCFACAPAMNLRADRDVSFHTNLPADGDKAMPKHKKGKKAECVSSSESDDGSDFQGSGDDDDDNDDDDEEEECVEGPGIGSAPVYRLQVEEPAEEDLKHWGHNSSTATVPDKIMRAIGDDHVRIPRPSLSSLSPCPRLAASLSLSSPSCTLMDPGANEVISPRTTGYSPRQKPLPCTNSEIVVSAPSAAGVLCIHLPSEREANRGGGGAVAA